MSNGREPRVIDTFLTLTDTLVRDFGALGVRSALAERIVELFDVAAVELLLADTSRSHRGPQLWSARIH